VPVQAIDDVWPAVSQKLYAGLRKAPIGETCGDLWVSCRSGATLMILAFDDTAIKATTLWRFTKSNYFECAFMVGEEAGTWINPICDLALKIAKNNGCEGIGGNGRPGWVRLLKRSYPKSKIVRQTYVMRCE
jgi:hypothetical protein